jgi:pyochelin biosynthetic protein PchC
MPDTAGKWFRRYGGRDRPELRLVCLPHAGGAASFFRTWPDSLPPWVEVLAVRYPGREDRLDEPPATCLEDVAAEVARAVTEVADRPVALFGHSMGSILAYEVGRLLRDGYGVQPVSLFVSGRGAPHRSRSGTRWHLASDDALLAQVGRAGHMAAAVWSDPALRAMALPVLRSDYGMVERYDPGPRPAPVHTPIAAYYGLDDIGCSEAAMQAWDELTVSRFSLVGYPGDHFYLVPARTALLADVSRRLTAGAALEASRLGP